MGDQKIPRKIRLDLATPPEVALRAALAAVEAMPPDTRLTQAGTYISAALDLVAGYVDQQMQGVSFDTCTCRGLNAVHYFDSCPVHGGRSTKSPPEEGDR